MEFHKIGTCPDSDLSDDGPAEFSPPEPFRCCLNVDEMVGLKRNRGNEIKPEKVFFYKYLIERHLIHVNE
jgi:hypothetical protein